MQESKTRKAATKRYSEDVVTIISENFNYIIGVCSLTRNDLINSNSPKKCMSGGSFDKLKAYKDKAGNNYDPGWVPQDQTIINFVSMINRFFGSDLKPIDLQNPNLPNMFSFTPKDAPLQFEWYSGLYYCYFLNTITHQIDIGLLKVNPDDTNSGCSCEAILGLNRSLFEYIKNNDYHKMIYNGKSLKDVFMELADENSDVKELDRDFYYFLGNVIMFKESLLFVLHSQRETFGRILTMNRYDQYRKQSKCFGAIASMLKTAHSKKSSDFQKIILSRYMIDLNDSDSVEIILNSLKFDDIHGNSIIHEEDEKNHPVFNMIRKYKGIE